MRENEVWDFVRNIVSSGSADKKTLALNELRRLMQEAGASLSCIEIVDMARNNLPETTQFADNLTLSENDRRIIVTRGGERRKREEEARRQSRC